MNNRKMKKGIKMSFIWNFVNNNEMTRHDAAKLFRKVRKLVRLQKREARLLGIPMDGAWWDKIDNERLKVLV